MYGCQLWYTGKQKGLVNKLQTIQNEAIKVISGTFCTTPCKALHQLLSILPMDLRLTMLTQNTALQLYKVLKESQLLRQLGGNWHAPQPHDFPLPTLNNSRAHTTLRTIAVHASPKGPQVDHFPDLPQGAPTWEGRVQWILKQKDWNYTQATRTLICLCKEGHTTNIFGEGTISNRNREDNKQVGAASVILYYHGREWKHIERIFRKTVTENDTALCSIILVLDVLTDFLASQQDGPKNILIFLTSNFAINKAQDALLHEEQTVSINCLIQIGELLDIYPNLNIRLLWLPRNIPSVGFKRMKQLALEAIHTAKLKEDEELH